MSNAATETHDANHSAQKSYVQSRIASVLAVVPLGAWVVVHLWQNLSAFEGAIAWSKSVTTYAHPLSQALSLIVVMIPLAIHAIWGIRRMPQMKPNLGQYKYYTNLKYILQRVSALVVMLFLGAHIYLAMLKPRLIDGHPERFADIAKEMRHHAPTLVVYLLGTLGVAYHLANGIATVAMSYGFVTKRKSMFRFEYVAMTLFVVLLTMSWAVIYALWSHG